MGFFRFRRSIKILPGVRWNIGKKSSSLSFGGRGFHYTVGSRGRRTTVGIPGTGLSYTSTSSSRSASSKRAAKQQLAEWARKQHKTVNIEYPEREPGEPDATQRQKHYIRTLAGIDEAIIAKLGKWQASALVERLKEEKERFNNEKVQEYIKMQKRGGCGRLIGLSFLCILVIGFVGSLFNHTDNTSNQLVSPSSPQAKTIPRPVLMPAQPGKPNHPSTIAIKPQEPVKIDDLIDHEAAQMFPQLGIANSSFRQEYIRRYNAYKHTDPDYFNNSGWRLKLAKECSDYFEGLSIKN